MALPNVNIELVKFIFEQRPRYIKEQEQLQARLHELGDILHESPSPDVEQLYEAAYERLKFVDSILSDMETKIPMVFPNNISTFEREMLDPEFRQAFNDYSKSQ